MNLKLLCLSVMASFTLVSCGGGNSGTESKNTTLTSQGDSSSAVSDNTNAIFNIPNVQGSDSLTSTLNTTK